MPRVRVRGAGIVGLACADELARRGHEVEVVDARPGSGASRAAAGMLSPSSEVWHGEEVLLGLGAESRAAWPAWAARLGVPLHTGGVLLVGLDAGDLSQVERQAALLTRLGAAAEPLGGRELRRLEPGLGRVTGGALLRDDAAVDPRAVVAALHERVEVHADPGPGPCDVEVWATGAWLPRPWRHLVRGVRGEVVRLRCGDPPCRTVRGWVAGAPTYVVPRPGSPGTAVEVVVGATSEEHDGPPVPTLGGVHRLLDGARLLLPGLDRAEVVEVLARDRPATADGLPLVGPAPQGRPDGTGPGSGARHLLAAGHHRHGVLLAPLTARLIADLVDDPAADPHPALDPRRTS
ncbi:FAD-dependent oxidoreductase [Nocardioides perillae]|uniref:Glycine oxidase n=1 Tax=Nocardioides perillae TaxID=1119534 RepID=A0A7Y9RWL6_9ACTN|nr:FAD-dependent oxidoreductase [Nocardioides perillae]NYG56746.1 glycine oxidase [Nocardioides perillae]